MPWHAYRLVYRLESPMHIGWRKTGNLMQTRLYVPGRNWWGVATSHLAKWVYSGDYQTAGAFVQENLIFGYFFLTDNPRDNKPCIPHQSQNDELERRFVRSLTSTAIDASSNTATEGQLHEVEFVVPHIARDGQEAGRVFLVGHLFARAGEQVRCEANEVYVDDAPLLTMVLQQIRIGGERRYGSGQIQYYREYTVSYKPDDPSPKMFEYSLNLDGEKPQVTVSAKQPLPAHVLTDNVQAIGEIEPFQGREWHANSGPGNTLSTVRICWAPGTIVQEEVVVTICSMGIMAVNKC